VAELDDQGASKSLERLKVRRQELTIRAESLPADLALLGLVDDLLGAAAAAIALAADESLTVVYPLTRIAFEAAQRIIVLATDDDYLTVGTRAWLYYHRRDAAILRKRDPAEAARWFEQVVAQLREMWAPHNPEAAGILLAENARLEEYEKKHRSDNFMGQDLADVVEARYPRILKQSGLPPSGLKSVNRGIYAVLCRESHARLRVEAAAIVISVDGTVQVVPRTIDEAARRETVLGCLESSLSEARGALFFLLERRKRLRTERLESAAREETEDTLPPGFKADLGLQLARSGGGGTNLHFLSVPVYNLGILPDGTARWCANVVFEEAEYATTFDVPMALIEDLAAAIKTPAVTLRPTSRLVMREVEGSPRVRLECTLGEVQRYSDQTFVPLVVKRLKAVAGP
jgi:hypothetical protein